MSSQPPENSALQASAMPVRGSGPSLLGRVRTQVLGRGEEPSPPLVL